MAELTASDGKSNDNFGHSAALSAEWALVGAENGEGLELDTGSAYMYPLAICELALALEPAPLRAGDELLMKIDLYHRRPVTVTRSLSGGEGRRRAGRGPEEQPADHDEPGDHRQLRMAVTLPPDMRPGSYRVLVGVRRMQQSTVWASRQFEIV